MKSGRGTSTYDGMSIARAVLEYVADIRAHLGAKALFAYALSRADRFGRLCSTGVDNYNIAVKKNGATISPSCGGLSAAGQTTVSVSK